MSIMTRFWIRMQSRLGIIALSKRLFNIEKELTTLRKKSTVKPKRYDQLERTRSEHRHPARHH